MLLLLLPALVGPLKVEQTLRMALLTKALALISTSLPGSRRAIRWPQLHPWLKLVVLCPSSLAAKNHICGLENSYVTGRSDSGVGNPVRARLVILLPRVAAMRPVALTGRAATLDVQTDREKAARNRQDASRHRNC